MPRPKNTTAAPGKVTSGTAKPMTARKTEQQLEVISAALDRDTAGSDDSEGLVKTQQNRVNTRGTTSQDMMMSGALGPGDTAGARVKPLAGRKRAILSRIVRNADHDKAIEALKARRDAALAAEKGIEIQVPSSIPSEPMLATEPMAERHVRPLDPVTLGTAKNTSVPATPRVGLISSSFRGSNFKRRPRQPSLLQLVQAQANPQDEHDDNDDLDDFHPDDESTPFLQAKSKGLPQTSLSSSESSANQSSSRKRKLSTPVIQVERSQSPETRKSSPRNSSNTPDSDPQEEDEEDVRNLPFPTNSHNGYPEPFLPMPESPQASQSRQWSDTCAPPRSSSPPIFHESPKPLLQRGQPRRNSPLASSPVSRPLKPLSTATLQNLLPRRRVRSSAREHDPFEMPSSSDVEIDTSRLSAEADELSVPAKPKVRAKKHVKDPSARTPATKKKKAHGTTGSKDDSRGAWAPKAAKKTQRLKKPKTYARAKPTISNEHDENNNASGDDNDNNPQDQHTPSRPPTEPSPATTELQRLARKFREVDRWELEVEDVTPSSGSQRDAR